ncbi:MAG: PQQ-binding-like beta-propeller repeat protein [Gemmatimonadales bacterium]|nr:PQQ-binding-like beta-propeller repeat protein [Gemmatimonadales bacterium]
MLLFRGSNDGRIYALDGASGRELWNVRAGDASRGETFPAAPVAWEGKVFVGNAGGDNLGVTGRIMAFDARSGGKLWTFEIVARNGPAAATWPLETERVPRAGGATWTTYTVDTAAGIVRHPRQQSPRLAYRRGGRRRAGSLAGSGSRSPPACTHPSPGTGERTGGVGDLRAALNRSARTP